MSENEFLDRAEAAMRTVEDRILALDEDADASRTGPVLNVELSDGRKLVINIQAAAGEIWVAARSGGFHYRPVEGGWRDTRGGEDLFAAVDRLVKAG